MINNIPVYLVTDSKRGTCMAVFYKDWQWSNNLGHTWYFTEGDKSDGHSTGSYFRHFDAWVVAALCHDQDCVEANTAKDYKYRRTADKDYKRNLKYLGASWSVIHRRYAAVCGYSRLLKFRGKLKTSKITRPGHPPATSPPVRAQPHRFATGRPAATKARALPRRRVLSPKEKDNLYKIIRIILLHEKVLRKGLASISYPPLLETPRDRLQRKTSSAFPLDFLCDGEVKEKVLEIIREVENLVSSGPCIDTIEEYNEAVKGYWNAIDTYRHMAVKFCDEIRKEKAREKQET